MAFVLVDIENANGYGPFDTKRAAEVAALSGDERLGGNPWGEADEGKGETWCVLDYDAKVMIKWTNGEYISFTYKGQTGLFRWHRIEGASLAVELADGFAAEERKLLEWSEISIRLQDYTVYLIESGYLAPQIFSVMRGERSSQDEMISEAVEAYIEQAQEAE